ncbi:MAG: hypothetical protein U1F58_11600 [Burkholderiales bacterium]
MTSLVRTAVLALGLSFVAVSPHAVAAPTAKITGGYTLVEFLPEFVGALASLLIAPTKVLPGTLYQRIGYFPITGGRIDAATAKGEVPHAGGLALTRGNTQVILSDFIIDTASGAPKLTGLVTADGSLVGRVHLFNIALPAGITLPLTVPPGPDILLIEGNKVTLSADAAAALNGLFATNAFTAGFNIGIASVYGNY